VGSVPGQTWRTRPGRHGSGVIIKKQGSAFFFSARAEQTRTEDKVRTSGTHTNIEQRGRRE